MAKQARIVNFESARNTVSRRRPSNNEGKGSAQRTSGQGSARSTKRNSTALKSSQAHAKVGNSFSFGAKASANTKSSSGKKAAKKPAGKGAFHQAAAVPASVLLAFASRFSPKRTAVLAVCICLVASCAFLYAPAKNYYIALRDRAKAEVAYEMVSSRNQALKQDVAALSTTEGMEDRVREQYGWVKSGENAVLVAGLAESDTPSVAEVLRTTNLNDVKAPETWYSPLLDHVFGYSG